MNRNRCLAVALIGAGLVWGCGGSGADSVTNDGGAFEDGAKPPEDGATTSSDAGTDGGSSRSSDAAPTDAAATSDGSVPRYVSRVMLGLSTTQVAPFGACDRRPDPGEKACVEYNASGWPHAGPLCNSQQTWAYAGSTTTTPPTDMSILAKDVETYVVHCAAGVGTVEKCPKHALDGGGTSQGVTLTGGGYACN